MGDGWFYSDGGRAVGPISIEELVAALRQRPDPLNCLVWNSQICAAASDVPEVAELIFHPEPNPSRR